ncbi:MAG TPA: Na+/H+ antiporter NhaA [Acidimicrobiia bacterium]|nr:Na+/H+ antiporter NhaA [Acidimicrobiia bacterium]
MAKVPPPAAEHITWLESERTVPRRFIRPLLRFTYIESAGGGVLLLAAVAALIWANSPVSDSYESFWATQFELTIGPLHLVENLRHVVNDGLMTIFFFVVGLEIKRELVNGDLRNPKAAALPVVAALGGMILPAVIYVVIAGGTEGAFHGWGIPMATDIAFAVGVVALLGSRVPVGGKLFLLALAIVDDIGAISVIAIFYTEDLALGYLLATLGMLAAMWAAQRVRIRSLAFYVPMGFLAWFFLFESGVHATLAGVAIGLLTPARSMYSDREYHDRTVRILERYDFDVEAPRGEERIDFDALEVSDVARESVAPLYRIENKLHPWSSFLVVPIFALANAGVSFAGVDLLEAATHPVALGVSMGLLVGKTVGIGLFAWLAVRLRLGVLPRNITWRHIIGLAAVAGIGFTVSLFVSDLAFRASDLEDLSKTGIFIGSALAGILGYLILRPRAPRDAAVPQSPEAGNVAAR